MVSFKIPPPAQKTAIANALANSANFETQSTTSFVDYSAVNTTITTNGGKVLVILTCTIYDGAGGDSNVHFRLIRNSSNASPAMVYNSAGQTQKDPASIVWIDNPSPGSVLYEAQYAANVGGQTVGMKDVTIAAIELKVT